MRNRWLSIGAVFLMALAVGLILYATVDTRPAGPGLTDSNLGRLEVGMTLEDVRAFLGPETSAGVVPKWAREEVGAPILLKWTSPDGRVVNVFFDYSFRYMRWDQFIRADTPIEKLRKQVGI